MNNGDYVIEIYTGNIMRSFEGYYNGIYRVAGETYPSFSKEISSKTKVYKTIRKAELGVKSLNNKFANYTFEIKEIEKSDN